MARILVTGSTGLLGGYLIEEAGRGGHDVIAPRRTELELRDAAQVEAFVARERPDVVVHAAAMAMVGDCARDPTLARAVNVVGTSNLVRAAKRARFVHVSTDLVFDGESAPYTEDAPLRPLSVYGQTKAEAEVEALRGTDAVVARVALLFGPTRTERRGFFDTQVEALRRGTSITLFDDEWRTPLSLRAAAEALLAIANGTTKGILHIGGPERMSRAEMGLRLARWLGIADPPIVHASRLSIPGEPRARDVSLDSRAFRHGYPGIATLALEDECARMG